MGLGGLQFGHPLFLEMAVGGFCFVDPLLVDGRKAARKGLLVEFLIDVGVVLFETTLVGQLGRLEIVVVLSHPLEATEFRVAVVALDNVDVQVEHGGFVDCFLVCCVLLVSTSTACIEGSCWLCVCVCCVEAPRGGFCV